MTRPPQPARRWLAAATAMALLAGGAIASAPAASAAYPDSFNPFAIGGGFTVYAREDATLGNTETEGSIAVGDTLTKPGDGQYTLVHVVAGTGDYTLPTVDGDPTRLLAGQFSPSSGGITAITSAGTTDPALQGDLKLVERGGPFEPFARADWLRLNTAPANPDHTPLIDATHQQYPDDASPPTTAAGDGSIYTVVTSDDAVAGYVEANGEATWEEAAQCLDDISDPTQQVGYPVTIAEDAGDRIVLAPLSADQPNILDYADIAGAALIQFSPGPEPGVQNPLIIRVPAGTTEVVGARADPQGAYSPYMLWDLSALTGDVAVTAAQGRMDGSIYAPEADVTVTAAPLDGQIIGRNVSTLGGEIHSFLFAGEIACVADSGTFRMRKAVDGVDPDDPRLADLTFTVNYSATTPDGETLTGALDLAGSGEWVAPGAQFPEGTVITFTEITPPTIAGYEWGTPTIDPNPLTITAGATADVVVENSATAQRGTFTVSKQVTATDGTTPVLTGGVTVDWTARYGGDTIDSGSLVVPFDGTPVSPAGDFPLGTVVAFTETLDPATAPAGYEWATAGWNPGRIIRVSDETTPAAVVVTNVLQPADTQTITVTKEVDGDAVDPRYGYAISYNVDAVDGVDRRTQPITVGEPIAIDDLESGATAIEIAELIPTFDSAPVDPALWDPPTFRVTTSEGTQEITAGGFEGQVALEDAIVAIPLPGDGGDIAVAVVNTLQSGTFTVAKQLDGIEADELPAGTAFTTNWSATTPSGTSSGGTIRLPADGAAVSPVDENGEALLFPYGTEVTLQEQTPPAVDGIEWGVTVVSPEPLVIGEGGAASVAATVTNSATRVTGTFQVAKSIVGIDPADLGVDAFTVGYVAVPPGGGVDVGSITLPADGTPAGPVDADGLPIRFPLGTVVVLAEQPPPAAALPDLYEWANPVWSPSRALRISDATEPALVTITNSAVAYAQVSVTKIVAGDIGAVPPDTAFAVDWWLDSEPQAELSLAAGQTVTSVPFPIGSIIEATEPEPEAIAGATWSAPQWDVDGQPLPVQPNGRVVVPISASGDETISFELINTITVGPTGGFAIEKTVEGGAAGAVPGGTRYPIEYRLNGGATISTSIAAGEPVVVEGLPAGTTVQVRELDPPDIEGVEWGSPVWSTGGVPLVTDDGWVTVTPEGSLVELTLVNTATDDLAGTGGTPNPWLIVWGALLVLGGVALVSVRRVRAVPDTTG